MILFWIFFVLVACYGVATILGAPYLPTRKREMDTAFELLNLKKGQTIYELGCGDGRLLREAARRGYKAVGYEINPILVVIARGITWRHRKTVRVVWGNFWRADLSGADGVFVFLITRFMPKLDKLLKSQKIENLPVASYIFKIPGKKHVKEQNNVFLYRY